MKCIYCDHKKTRVIEKRDNNTLRVSRRRRECLKCSRRFTTYEKADISAITVVKRDKSEEQFDTTKIRDSVRRVVKGRRIPLSVISSLVDKIETDIMEDIDKAYITSQDIADYIKDELYHIDKEGYVKYASVQYFKDNPEEYKDMQEIFKSS